jgi:hypothetical protein
MRKAITAFAISLLAMATSPCLAQTARPDDMVGQVYRLPFASTGNGVELTVANTSGLPLSGVTVEATGLPSWLKFKETRQNLPSLKANQEIPVVFTFSVDKSAPVNKEQVVAFTISSGSGQTWSKQIKVSVAPPEKFELFQNYPNPFNPATAISYQLSAESRVSLKVFNILGQEVAPLVDGERLAGHHEERWDAKGFPSGMYVYQLSLTDEKGDRHVARKAMILLK